MQVLLVAWSHLSIVFPQTNPLLDLITLGCRSLSDKVTRLSAEMRSFS